MVRVPQLWRILTVVPALAGTQGHGSRQLPLDPRFRGSDEKEKIGIICRFPALPQEIVVKVAPLRVLALDQFELPRPPPLLDPLLAQDRVRHGFVKLGIDQFLDMIFSGESMDLAGPMLPNAAREVARYPDVERPILPARQNVYARAPIDHFGSAAPPGSPLSRGRRRKAYGQPSRVLPKKSLVIPAKAGT